jgi:polysaccharide export outer membrane protein
VPDANKDYRLGPDDLVRVDVFQVEGLSCKVRVNSNGEIALPLIGGLSVVGLTAREAEELVKRKFGERYLQNPQVSVSIEEFTSQRVVVDGSVKKPGVYPLTGRMTLLQLFALANGFTEEADTSHIKIFRTNSSGKKEILSFNVDAIRDGSVKDTVLQGGDVIEVDKDFLKVVWKNIKDTVRITVGTQQLPLGN